MQAACLGDRELPGKEPTLCFLVDIDKSWREADETSPSGEAGSRKSVSGRERTAVHQAQQHKGKVP